MKLNEGLAYIHAWFASKSWQMKPFQEECATAYLSGKSGLLNAPTGSGKTYALWLPCLAEAWLNTLKNEKENKQGRGLQILWITPLRALSKDLQKAMQIAVDDLALGWRVGLRTGDTESTERQKQKKQMPECLLTTPESLHILFSGKGYADLFKNLKAVIVDEWHELMSTKRGVQMELAISRLVAIQSALKIWGISATIGNLEEAKKVLTFPLFSNSIDKDTTIIRANIQKKIDISSILPDTIERFPWAGHLGTNLIYKILPIIEQSKTTLLFTNTRSQTEIWYQKLLDYAPELAGQIAMHHGSLDNEIRTWVENALHEEKLKVVVCTSSLDLGVDFRPVDTVIQVGSPKGVARFLQRAGRSGHRPDAISKIYFLPTHALELLEAAALKTAVKRQLIEKREPLLLCFDVLVQYLLTLAVSDGFDAEQLYDEIITTHCYQMLSKEEWLWALEFITTGGNGLAQYDDYKKVERQGNFYQVKKRKVAYQHRLSIGTIVSDPVIKVKYLNGSHIGSVEESFIARLNEGDVFWFAGRNLEFVMMKEMNALVRKTNKKSGILPRWAGGRLPLSSELSDLLREQLEIYLATNGQLASQENSIELQAIAPILILQKTWSIIPTKKQLLIEQLQTQEGHHLFFYTFEGRAVHEVLASLIAFRISKLQKITFSFAMNDYGFELLSDQEIPIQKALATDLFSAEHLLEDLSNSLNETEMAKRKFRDIAAISGLIFQGYPNKYISKKHLQASTSLLFDVFRKYDNDNLLIHQAYVESINLQLDLKRLQTALEKTNHQEIVLKKTLQPTPFAFPILVDRLREKLSSESLEDRVKKMTLQLEKLAG
ncbi:ligase-associated DNA damage response DEXH box helicase [Thermoflexibacter ruber]|uniref:ATP-dependent helicase Lhr and Lhr-like helicase n=1 Tax=Thermoflexibacter ruber TaxID=1003 RepID=A0A1I2BNL3_9BACT|nr:ligase-associated DNA damage response DEXH box helicase [Thermoflexibacter ruber]SFE57597.1 ATP-dependent helicase Lhr and Lhr-like helicase [Thermoflexibacter ruber]